MNKNNSHTRFFFRKLQLHIFPRIYYGREKKRKTTKQFVRTTENCCGKYVCMYFLILDYSKTNISLSFQGFHTDITKNLCSLIIVILAFTGKYHTRNVRLVSFEDLNLDIYPSTLWVLLQGEIVMNILGWFDIFISISHSLLLEKIL